jgi:capsular polysaccharide biosynthesis protein
MQMFKYIPYTKLEGDDELNISNTDNVGNNIDSNTELVNTYKEIYKSEDNVVPVITINDLKKKMESHKYLKDMLASKMIQNDKVLFDQYNVEVIE